MKKKEYYYFDMDGVLTDFNNEANALQRFNVEPTFFEMLKPIINNLFTIKELLSQKESVRIITMSPNEQADKSKLKWLKKYVPELKRKNIIILRLNDIKAKHIQTKKGILFDDYGKNCKEWQELGYTAYKITEEYNVKYYLENMCNKFQKNLKGT